MSIILFCIRSSLNYSRVEVAADARHRHMKLWFSTANRPNLTRDVTKQMW